MLVLSVAYPLFPVSPDSAGGAEQILHSVERGLVRAGHRSIVVAAAGSQVSGTLVAAAAANGTITETDRAAAQALHQTLIHQVLEREAVDILHFHGLDFHTYLPAKPVPMVATLHLPAAWYALDAFAVPGLHLVCVSRSQAATLPEGTAATVIPNGVEPPTTSVSIARGPSFLWLGRICPEKGTDIALRVAHRLQVPLTVAGPVHGFAAHREYFEREVVPLLDEHRQYIGPVGKEHKFALLRAAKAVLIPSLAPETSSLVAMEAILAGAPVVAFASGALPEVVTDGVNGFIVHSEEQMAEAALRVHELPMTAVPPTADDMVAAYLALYRKIEMSA